MKKIKGLIDKPVVGPLVARYVNYRAGKEATAISDHFNQYFTPQIASTPELQHEVFSMRHKVYCEEMEFLQKSDDKLERDKFDQHSIHCILRHNSGEVAGTVRLVVSDSDDRKLPIEAYCMESMEQATIKPWEMERTRICEVSRVAVAKTFRKRKADKHKGAALGALNEDYYSESELRCYPFIALGLYFTAASIVIRNGIDHVFVMTEPWIAQSVKFAGINWQPIGPAMDFHGIRAPYYISPTIFKDGLSPSCKKLFEGIDSDISEFFRHRELKELFQGCSVAAVGETG